MWFNYSGKLTASEFINKVGRNAAKEAVEVFLQFIGLKNKVSVDDVCDQQAIMDNQGGINCFSIVINYNILQFISIGNCQSVI